MEGKWKDEEDEVKEEDVENEVKEEEVENEEEMDEHMPDDERMHDGSSSYASSEEVNGYDLIRDDVM